MSISDELLMAHALGALDPGDALALDEALPEDRPAAFRMTGLGLLAEVEPRGAHFDPLPSALDSEVDLAGGERPQVGDRITVGVEPPVDPTEARCVVFEESPAGRRLLHPSPGRPWPTLDRFPVEEGQAVLNLVLAEPPGLHTFEVLLLPADLFEEPWPQEDARWGGLLDRYRRGQIAGTTVEVEVEAT